MPRFALLWRNVKKMFFNFYDLVTSRVPTKGSRKKSPSLNDRAINAPPPSSVWNVGKKVLKQVFSLNGLALPTKACGFPKALQIKR